MTPAEYHLLSYNTYTGVLTEYPGLKDNLNLEASIYNSPSDQLWVYFKDKNKKKQIANVSKSTGTMLASYSIPDEIDLPDLFVSQMFMDGKGILWLATGNGLYAFNENDKTWQHWKNIPGNNNSLSSDKLLSICPDPLLPGRYLWIGTEGAGFNRFDKLNYNSIRYTENDGLPNNVAYCILSDSLNNLWISTNNGLSCFNPVQKTFRNFNDDDGLPCNEFNRYTAMRMQNGELMFGGVDGFVIFNPKEVLQKQEAAPVVFTGLSIFNRPVSWKTNGGNLDAPIEYAKTLTLKPGQNIFSISFATLEYRSNVKKMYKYKLEGFDKDWTSPGNRNEVTYTNLSPGSYTFYVMGANTDGMWNEKPISMKIVVLPYWYQTLVFKIAILLLLAAALYAFYRYRLKQGLKLEKLRNRIARDLHDEIGSTLSSISIYAASAQKLTSGNQKTDGILSKISTGTTEMMEAMNDIVWAVNTSNDHFDNLANRMRSFAVKVTEAKNIELQFTENKDIPDLVLGMEQRKNIYLICKEAISNAVKYSNCTLMEVLIGIEQHRLLVTIRDNGKGFISDTPEHHLSGNSFGGNGLKNMRERAAEINAVLEIFTAPGKGTTVTLGVPQKKS
ncbi:MAG: triple tyrosine motif-containing protein [Ferruginibacter sp.]